MKKLLVIGASILQLPAIIKGKELGYYLGVVDLNPDAIGVKYADEFFNISTTDAEEIIKIAEVFSPDGIITIATDMPMRAIANATSKLGLIGITPETAIKATDKGEMIKAFQNCNVKCPWFFIVENKKVLETIKSKIEYPCIFKPTDNAGSRGVILVNSNKEIDIAYNYSKAHSKQGIIVIEEYLNGHEVSVEVLVVNSEVNILAITDKLTSGPPFFVEMGHSQPSLLSESDQEEIKALAKRSIQAVGIDKGPAHIEIILTKNGPKMVELGARLGGDNITSHLVPLSTGVDMVKAIIDIAVGNKPDIDRRFSKASAIRYFNIPPGIITSIEGIEIAKLIKGVIEVNLLKEIGDTITEIRSSVDRVGYVIAQGENAAEAIEICERALEKIKIITL